MLPDFSKIWRLSVIVRTFSKIIDQASYRRIFIMATKTEFKKELFLKIKDRLRCFKCASLPRPESKFELCSNGHTVCSKCSCCSKTIPNNVVNELLVDLDLPYQCAFGKYGCEELLKKDDLSEHEECCVFRRINCPDVDCKAKDVGFLELSDHVQEKHYDDHHFELQQMRSFRSYRIKN